MKVRVGVSARHVHLTREGLEVLFGKGYELEPKKDLSQPGQFASMETVKIKTEKGEIDKVRILGPVRSYNQVEISKTDAVKLGLNPPVRDSGDIKGSEPITLVGPLGVLRLEEGCILATRHIHISHEDREKLGLKEDVVRVKVTNDKGGILENVKIKEADPSTFELHLDTDDANAHLIAQNDVVEIRVEE